MDELNGIFCVTKPEGWTSFDVVAKIRGIAHTRKVGHAGTLDPMATGVLPIFVGNATKACDVMPGEDKAYHAVFQLGVVTDTQDRTGKVLEQRESFLTEDQIQAVLPFYTGIIEQIPPMYSAVQINGKRLYELAREGKEVERKPRKITIYSLCLTSFDPVKQIGVLDVHCTKGTYIRTLVHDIGQQLGVGAVLIDLERYQAGVFSLKDCYSIEELQTFKEQGKLSDKILPIGKLFDFLPPIQLNAVQTKKFKNGVRLDLNRICYENKEGLHRVLDQDQQFLGLAKLNLNEMELILVKLFVCN